MGLITEEVEITISGNNVDYWENKGYYGYGNNTKEQFEKWYDCTIKISNIGEIKLQTTKKVYCFETDTIYDSVVKCAEKLNVNQEGIRRCCIKICKSYRQYHFYITMSIQVCPNRK